MSTFEEFEAAPVGATATNPYQTVVKTGLSSSPWVGEVRYPGGRRSMERVTSEYLVEQGFTLDPTPAAPTTAREALDLAWNLAHPVKEGQVIPKGATVIVRYEDGSMDAYDVIVKQDVRDVSRWGGIRTLDPPPEPEPEPEPTPDWLNAPAVLATCGCRGIELWQPHNVKDGIWVSRGGENALWTTLRDVTPLYPTLPDVTPLYPTLRDVTPLYPKEDA